jgi:hypothetical protein
VSYEFDAAAGRATIVLEQTQSADWPTFRLPLELEITTARGSVRHRVEVTGRRTETSVQLDAAPVTVALDPDGWVLEERVDGQGATSR